MPLLGRSFLAMVQLLDHQLVSRDGAFAGKADDAEVTIAADGSASITALLTGPGVLATRLGHSAYGRWRERVESSLDAHMRQTRIPVSQVAELGVTIRLAVNSDDLASHGTEDWAKRHVIDHIPGAHRRDH